MHYAHLNFCLVLTAAMRGLESGLASRNRRAQHTQHLTNNYYHINIRIASDTNETTTIPIDRSSYSTTQYRRTWPTDRLSTRGSAPGPRWGRCPQTPVFSRFALVISRCAFNAVLSSSSNRRNNSKNQQFPPTHLHTPPRGQIYNLTYLLNIYHSFMFDKSSPVAEWSVTTR